jgi:hypothetical protein
MFGSSDEPPLTGLEQEMNKMQLKDYQLFNTRTVPNASVDLILRQRLAKGIEQTGEPSLAVEFEDWRKNAPANKRFGTMTYDEIVASADISEKDKKATLEGWIKLRIRQERDRVETMFNSYVAEKPLQARGYIRNNYAIIRNREGADVFDRAAKRMGFPNADSMISSSENVKQEIDRRLRLLAAVPQLVENEPYQ